MSELSLIGLKKIFERGTPNQKLALDGIDLEVAKGDFITMCPFIVAFFCMADECYATDISSS